MKKNLKKFLEPSLESYDPICFMIWTEQWNRFVRAIEENILHLSYDADNYDSSVDCEEKVWNGGAECRVPPHPIVLPCL